MNLVGRSFVNEKGYMFTIYFVDQTKVYIKCAQDKPYIRFTQIFPLRQVLQKFDTIDLIRSEKNSRIGFTGIASNGLCYEITDEFVDEYNQEHVVVTFSDGVKVTEFSDKFPRSSCGKVSVIHPNLKPTGKCSYMGFNAKRIFHTKDKSLTLYECECQSCGLKDVLTPEQIITHHKACIKRIVNNV